MDVFEKVMEMRDAHASSEVFAAFDFDGSIIYNDSAEAVLAYMARYEISTARKDFERYHSLLDDGDTEGAYRFGAGTLQGLSTAQLRDIVHDTLFEEGMDITKTELLGRTINKGIKRRVETVRLMGRLRSCKVKIVIVSASPRLIVQSAMQYFGIEADLLIGIRNIIRDEIVMAELQEPLSIYGGKVTCIQELVSPSVRPLLGVGDSENDRLMLEYSLVQAVVDRGNSLAELAKERGWFRL